MKKLKEFLRDNIIIPPSMLEFTKVMSNIVSLALFIIFNTSVFLVGTLFVTKWMIETNLLLTLILLVFVVYGLFIVLKSNK